MGICSEIDYYTKRSFSQLGEDLILEFLFVELWGIGLPNYIEIGANHPMNLSNTFRFYQAGAKGILIEPNPILCKNIEKYRSRDICVNAAIGEISGQVADFYVLNPDTLSSLSKESADAAQKLRGAVLEKIIRVPIYAINDILSKWFSNGRLDLFSIDTEGYEMEILKGMDFKKYAPRVIVAETISDTQGKILS